MRPQGGGGVTSRARSLKPVVILLFIFFDPFRQRQQPSTVGGVESVAVAAVVVLRPVGGEFVTI